MNCVNTEGAFRIIQLILTPAAHHRVAIKEPMPAPPAWRHLHAELQKAAAVGIIPRARW